MKILQINAWTGRMKGAIERFVHDNPFDIICMQEAVWCDEKPAELEYFVSSLREIQAASGLQYCAKVSNWGVNVFDGAVVNQGNVILSREPIIRTELKHIHGEYIQSPIFEQGDDHAYFAMKSYLENGLCVVNYHGYWLKDPLGDQETIRCMRLVADWIRDESGPLIMCGDLNISPESPALNELNFLHDLTAENGVRQTLQNIKFVKDVACDHVLVNDKIQVNDFKVNDQILSDHKTITVDFDIIT